MTSQATAVQPLNTAEIQELALNWYRKLDVHAPLVELLPLLAEEGLAMVFPEATLRGQAEFEGWYEGVIRIFFDEVHTVKSVESTINGDRADVKVIVHWEASVWNPPAAASKRISLDAYQTWVVTRSSKTEQPVVLTYTVDKLVYDEGSATL
jgi:hypothetical protein